MYLSTCHFKFSINSSRGCTEVLDSQRDTVLGINAAIDIEAGESREKDRLKRRGMGEGSEREQCRGMGEGYVVRL